MTDRQPPPWDTDSLSKYFADAEYNERVTAINYPDIYDLLRRLQRAFEQAEETIEKGFTQGHFLVPRILLPRAHSAVLASIRLSMSGQSLEALCVLRSAIEQAWYDVHIGTDSARAETWLRRNESDDAQRKCKAEFTVANVRGSHEALDVNGAADMRSLYEIVIDFGAHPNQLGVLNSMQRVETSKQVDYRVGILFPQELRVMMGVRLAVAVGVGVLNAYRVLFPERFALVGLDREITVLGDALNVQFRRFAQPPVPS
jgi:hypothetical protein